jgi:hypothetical protein
MALLAILQGLSLNQLSVMGVSSLVSTEGTPVEDPH